MRHPSTGRWHVSDGWAIEDGFCSSLRAAAAKIERMVAARDADVHA
jgi:hypothetical protein